MKGWIGGKGWMGAVLPIVFALGVSGCPHAQAKSVPDGPPLDVPPPPPREIATLGVDAPPAAVPEEPARTAPARPRPAATPPRAETPKPDTPVDPARRADDTAK